MADTSTNSWKLLYETGRQALQARKLQEAEQSFSAALQLAEDFAPGDPRLAATLNALARIYSLQRRYLAAAALLNRLLEVTERTLGGNHVQVAGVLTNLAEMYTHLGAAREELELRERVLAIRADDPNADATSLDRLRERVTELRSTLAAQEPPAESEDEADFEPLPVVRTAEYSTRPEVVREPEVVEITPEPIAAVAIESVQLAERDDAYRLSPATSQLSVAPWPGAAATGSTPTGGRTIEIEQSAPVVESVPATVTTPSRQSTYAPSYDRYEGSVESEEPMLSFHSTADHGFSDMGRDELASPIARRLGSRKGILSVAAGVVLVAGILAARSFVSTGAESVSGGSVSLANASLPAAVTTPVSAPAEPTPDPRSVDRLAADHRAERETKRVIDESSRESVRPATSVTSEVREQAVVPRVQIAADVERALRGLDGAVKAIDVRTKAATDSATAIRMQAPTFKKSKLAEP